MGEISMSGSTRERGAAVIGLWACHSVLSSLLYWSASRFGFGGPSHHQGIFGESFIQARLQLIEHGHGRAQDFAGELFGFQAPVFTTDFTDGTDFSRR